MRKEIRRRGQVSGSFPPTYPSRPGLAHQAPRFVCASTGTPVLVGGIAVDPILTSGLEHQLGTILDLQTQRVQAGRERRRAETQYIVVRHVVGERDKTRLQVLVVVKVKELASGEVRD